MTDKIELFERMALIRQCELQLNEAFAKNLFPGYIHSYLGQEACAVGMCAPLSNEDKIVSTHRGRGHYLAKGMALEPMVAEMFGKETGICGGRAGEMHAADPDLGILGGNGIVGAGLPIAAGAAYSAQLDGTGAVTVAFFGEGASNNGSFGETMNVAAAWKLPLVLVCENNLYAEMTPFSDTVGEKDVAKRAVGYGMQGEVVDGNDVLAVREAAERAVERARKGGGPTLLELKTYRWGGHFEGDPRKYRTRDEEKEWQERCPLRRFREKLIESGEAKEAELDAIEEQMKADVAKAIEMALAADTPAPETAHDHVYVPGEVA
ncbi:MAG: thiamine pyrophosphate-dependent dehydrogenase E1 component subunit alpha [Rhizobiaceae bacterium]|nr:thiamine pyrophosphate-dependent dehydrogenase E1 component subunit alpha [Rhizobiaceae bacterium]